MQAELLPEYQAAAASTNCAPVTVYSAASVLSWTILEHVCKEHELKEGEDTVHKFE